MVRSELTDTPVSAAPREFKVEAKDLEDGEEYVEGDGAASFEGDDGAAGDAGELRQVALGQRELQAACSDYSRDRAAMCAVIVGRPLAGYCSIVVLVNP